MRRRLRSRRSHSCAAAAIDPDRSRLATFLLIHGAWHGAWCWDRIVPLLRAAGHDVIAPDLPALGADRTPWWRATAGRFARATREAARGAAPVIAVGHSMGGLVITRAAVEEPRLFAGLVYLCAFAPQRGESLLSLGRSDAASRVPAAARWGFGRISIRPERAIDAFYNGCAPDDAERSIARLVPNPIWPLIQRIDRPDDLGVPQAYIECTRDQAISIDLQRRMHRRFAMQRVVTMEADHSPFLSAPDALAAHLDSIAAVFTGSAS